MQQSNIDPLTYGPRGTGRRLVVPTDEDVRASVKSFQKRQAHRADRRTARDQIAAQLAEVEA